MNLPEMIRCFPIRLLWGNNNKLNLIYENEDAWFCTYNLTGKNSILDKIKFIDGGQSVILFRFLPEPGWILSELRIRRDFHAPGTY
ncbi:hypothetical protein A2300_01610 [Candidatus Falkowbacteria bacterium RIFOXYB2_FULL_35_7]|nr:MAG: hypothetical protein A2300_01610 [Candidatus Falkowbacteria bacterium RIFOXYB2_FULL_35_7]